MKLEELETTKQLSCSQLCSVDGTAVTIFTAEKEDDEYQWGPYHGKAKIINIPRLDDEGWYSWRARILGAAVALQRQSPGNILFTGLHKENDWARTYWWDRGSHLVNTTGDYAVLSLIPQSR